MKKVSEPKNDSKKQTSQKGKTKTSTQSVKEPGSKVEKAKTRKVVGKNDSINSNNRKTTLADNNSLKPKVLKQKTLPKSKPNNEKLDNLSIIKRKQPLSKSKTDSVTKTSVANVTRNTVQKQNTVKKKANILTDSKGTASNQNNKSKPVESRKSKESTTVKKDEKSTKEQSLKNQKLVSNATDSKTISVVSQNHQEPMINIERNVDDDYYNYDSDTFEEYISDSEDNSAVSLISEESGVSTQNADLEPIELYTEEKKRTIHSANQGMLKEQQVSDISHYDSTRQKNRNSIVEMLAKQMENLSILQELE